MSLWTRIKEDWERQPLAIIGQASSLGFAILLAIWGTSVPVTSGGFSSHISNASVPLAVTALSCSAIAPACRFVFAKSVIAGFFASLVGAAACLSLFSQLASDNITKTTTYINDSYQGPMIDVAYWTVLSIFVAVCATPVIQRIFVTWGQISRSDAKGFAEEKGVAPIEFLMVLALWGFCLSNAQQKIIAAFVFEQPPQILQKK